jgi:hypothetical protein
MSELASQEAVMNGTLLVFHVGISLIGIASGVVVMYGLLTGRPHGGWTFVFLATTVLTSVTGFPLPATQLLPSHIVGVISLVLLAAAIVSLYVYHLGGAWRAGSISPAR